MVKEIPLTQGKVALVDDEDYEELNKFKWYTNKLPCTYYAAKAKPNRSGTEQMHRIILNAPLHLQVDHIDGNGLNNQKSNLRLVTPRENTQNRHHKMTSKYPGVSFKKQSHRWVSQIYINNKKIHLGYYKTEIEAYNAYKEALPC